ncbi:hypothetical protein [Lentzea sp. NBC_00516]|uniref:hypothetical protein n=1 Tax=Lentzea sp. NBC_00516 TaxID=2903582 RepID=UPI002E80D8A6|nr:hypothetical protein [Lentzea sp. NBC_00516]
MVDTDDEWATLITSNGRRVSFQRVDDYSPPSWPGQEHPQQMHLDVTVTDPAGHPFCLVTN